MTNNLRISEWYQVFLTEFCCLHNGNKLVVSAEKLAQNKSYNFWLTCSEVHGQCICFLSWYSHTVVQPSKTIHAKILLITALIRTQLLFAKQLPQFNSIMAEHGSILQKKVLFKYDDHNRIKHYYFKREILTWSRNWSLKPLHSR